MERARGRTNLALAGLAVMLAAVTACGDDNDDSSGSGDSDDTEAAGDQPGALEDESEAHRIVEALVHEASERTSELYEDPSELDDPSSNRLDRLVMLYTPDNPFPETIEEHLRMLADDGVAYLPGPGGFHERIRVFDLTTLDEDTVRFQYCAALSIEITDPELDDPYLAELRTGAGEARRTEGTWQIHDMVTPTEPREWDPETLAPDECDHMGLEQLELIIDVTDPELFDDSATEAGDADAEEPTGSEAGEDDIEETDEDEEIEEETDE